MKKIQNVLFILAIATLFQACKTAPTGPMVDRTEEVNTSTVISQEPVIGQPVRKPLPPPQ